MIMTPREIFFFKRQPSAPSRPHRHSCIRTKANEGCPQKLCKIDEVTVGEFVDMVACERCGQWFHCYCVNYTNEVNASGPIIITVTVEFNGK